MSGQGLDGHIIFHHALNLAASLGTRGLLEGSWRGFGGSWRGLEGSLRAQTIICPPKVWAPRWACPQKQHTQEASNIGFVFLASMTKHLRTFLRTLEASLEAL